MKNTLIEVLEGISDQERAKNQQRFFQCQEGGYGEGDIFWGIRNPELRKIAQIFEKQLSVDDMLELLQNRVHEIRLMSIFLLQIRYKNKTTTYNERKRIIEGYLNNLNYVNNWDLVDSSAYQLLGAWCFQNSDNITPLKLAQRDNMWNNRVGIIATFYHIKQNDFNLTLKISDVLIDHKHDLIHKAVGWMLREIGNRDMQVELEFLSNRYKSMPRTMLRYAIEKFEEPLRQSFLKGTY